jgi:multidrug resistance protein, MATE family
MYCKLSQSKFLLEFKACFRLSVPLIAAQLTESVTAFVDTMMMGWFGSETIAAGGLKRMARTILKK